MQLTDTQDFAIQASIARVIGEALFAYSAECGLLEVDGIVVERAA
jgi:hypothetical protein